MLISCTAEPAKRGKFMGLDFQIGPEALIPRPETECLCANALKILSDLVCERGEARVYEPCTGSGNLAVTLAYREPSCRIWATDVSEPALELARKNAADFDVADHIRSEEHTSELQS